MKSLKLKFYLIFITTIIAPILIMGVLFSYIYLSQIEKRILAEQNDLLDSLKVNIVEKHISDTEALLLTLSKDKNIPFIFSDPEIQKIIINDWKLCQELFPERCWIYYGSAENNIIVSPEWTPPRGYNLLTRPWYLSGKESDIVRWTEPYPEYITGDLIISATIGIKDQNNRYTGVLSVDTASKDFLKLMKNYDSDKKIRLIIVSDDGYVVSLNQSGDQLIINNESFDWKTIFDSDKKIIKIKDNRYYYQISSIPKQKMSFVSLIPAESVEKEIFPVFLLIYLFLLLSLASAILAGFLLSKDIIGKIVQINKYIGSIAKNDYKILDIISGNDEFKTVNLNLNKLAQTIQTQIDDLAILNRDLNKELEDNKNLVELRTSLLHIFSHNSSSLIMHQLDICKELLEKDKNNKTLINIHSASRDLRTLNENIMTYLKLDEGIIGDYYDEVDLGYITRLIINNTKTQYGIKNIEIILKSNEISILYSNYFLVRVLLENLIDNALKYSFYNSIVRIEIEERDRYIRWIINDGGPGFTDEDKKRMYGKFRRLSAKPTGSESSTGLGLYLVKTISDYLNIELNLITAIDTTGACFELIFSKKDASEVRK